MAGVENSRNYEEGKGVLKEACPVWKGKDVWAEEAKPEVKGNAEQDCPLISRLWRGMARLSSIVVLGLPKPAPPSHTLNITKWD